MGRRKLGSVKWFSSDHHFGHSKIIEYENRPFETVDKMDEAMITRWNECVGTEDICYIIGDFSFHRFNSTKNIVQRLNGRKHLIWGNHDDFNRNRLLKIFDSVYDQAVIQLTNSIRVKLSHFPYITPEENQETLRHRKFRPYHEGHWLLHGHVHSRWKINESLKAINVGVDVWDFKPVNYEKIIAIIERAKNECDTIPQKT
jgi:calcineurin-like phosphoesterase family protein